MNLSIDVILSFFFPQKACLYEIQATNTSNTMIIFLNRVPTPNLRQYCYFSLGSLFFIVIYAQKIFRDLLNEEGDLESWKPMEADNHGTLYMVHGYISATSRIILNEPWCIWVLINFSYCCLILFSKIIQELIFGKLRVVENQVTVFGRIFIIGAHSRLY